MSCVIVLIVLLIQLLVSPLLDAVYMDPLLHLVVYFCIDLQVFTGSRPPSGWYHSNQTSALAPGVGVHLMESWGSSTSSSSLMSKMDPHAFAWPVSMQ